MEIEGRITRVSRNEEITKDDKVTVTLTKETT
jgi:hypothetical protein